MVWITTKGRSKVTGVDKKLVGSLYDEIHVKNLKLYTFRCQKNANEGAVRP